MKYTSPFQVLMLAAGLAAALVTAPARAEKADKDKPMNIEADALRYDDLKQTSQFTGNVVMTKGTLVIRAGRVDVRQDAQGYQFGVATGAGGKPAYFRQKRDGVDELIEGEAETIDYDGKADGVRFTGKAVLRRFRGATLTDESSGNQIYYDNTTDVFTVDGGVANASAANPGGRVRALLTPRAAASAASSASSAAPVELRGSGRLSGPKP